MILQRKLCLDSFKVDFVFYFQPESEVFDLDLNGQIVSFDIDSGDLVEDDENITFRAPDNEGCVL